MTNEARPDRLSRALRELQSRPASPGFTESVLSRLDGRDRRRRTNARIVLVVGAALVVMVLGALFVFLPATGPPGIESSAEADEIRRQYRMLQAELEELQRTSDRSRTVLYLGANEEYDLVLDLNPLLDQRIGTPAVPAMQDLRARPALAREAERRQP